MRLDIKRTSQDFIIRLYKKDGQRVNRLIGVRSFIDHVGNTELAEKLVTRAYESPDHRTVVKLRRGLEFHFVNH